MYSPGQHIPSTPASTGRLSGGETASVIDQCIAELNYSQVALTLQLRRLSGWGEEFCVSKGGSHD
ncbi:hypothetical protein I6N98_07765 [Spongiibacter nanhainus]|uniref:Uncharacterized protein n=1 Tax=Spongiibacter nanhainus TaxID=2794344 RepID=A0A7T4URE1_9GAMM|nr:hypothetical protein [Spongiibacter nanhainus]QQD19728.1 hypothetical protein I6N98_07765 [Spongiibacter nanhainus]